MKDFNLSLDQLSKSSGNGGARAAAQRARSNAKRKIEDSPDLRIYGPFMEPKSKFEERYGNDAVANLDRKLKTHGHRKNEGYQCSSWNDPVGVLDRVESSIDQLLSEDEKYAALLSRPDVRLLRTGVIQAGGLKRDSLGLKSAWADPLYVETVETILLCLMEGVVKMYPTESDLQNAILTVRIPSGRGKGLGWRNATDGLYSDCAAGWEADESIQKIIFPKMKSSKEGIFMFEHDNSAIISGYRVQPPGMVDDGNGHLVTKWRASQVFPNVGADYIVMSEQWEPADGYSGMRIRLINNVPMIVNMPLVVVDKIFMTNLVDRLKPIFKRTAEELATDTIGNTVLDTDFGQFEFTQELNVREFVATKLCSERVANLDSHINKLDLCGAYVDQMNESPQARKGNEKKDDNDESRVWWTIPRFNDPSIAALFAVLTSGTGTTSILGKVLGAAEPATNLVRTLNMKPREFWGYPGKKDCLATRILRNTGDDCRTLAGVVRDEGITPDFRKWFESYVNETKTANRYDLDVEGENEGGGKYIGQQAYNKDGVCPTDPDHVVEFCHTSHISLCVNNLMKESTIDSHHRPLSTEWQSMAGAIDASHRSMVDHGGRDEGYWSHHVERMLSLSDCPSTVEEIFMNAEEERIILLQNSQLESEVMRKLLKKPKDELTIEEKEILDQCKQQLVMEVVEHFGLKNADEIVWKLNADDIEREFGATALSLLFITIPHELTKDIRRFINMDTYHEVRSDLAKAS